MGRHERARLVRQWMILNAGALGVMYSPAIKQAAVVVKKSVFPGGNDDVPPPAGSGGGFGPVTESSSGTNSNEFALLDQPYAGIVLLVIAVASAALIYAGSKKTESNA